jgi:ubiquinone/menaquinone biosynthesis C-methylase UbiE
LAERLLVMAQAKADAQKLTNATFRQADMENLGYSDDTFDAVSVRVRDFLRPRHGQAGP